MLGLMQDWPLLMHRVIDHAARHHSSREVVSRSVEGPIHRTTYAEVRTRALRLAQRLTRDGIRPGDRVATMAWNTWRHLEAWYGITGVGAVYHTINPRLFEDQIVWILNHAESRLMLADPSFVPLLEKLADRLPHIERFVILTDAPHMPPTRLRGAIAYEDWIGECDGDFVWRSVDENAAAGLCYTSGTTGEPKGVLYSHRSNMLLAMSSNSANAIALTARDRVLGVVPMFHANGWLLPFCAPMAGAALLLPGPRLDGASLHALAEEERATYAAAVPTLWAALLQHLNVTGGRLTTLRRVAIGGSAVPRAMIEAYDRYGVRVEQGWGMTEMSPLGTYCAPKPEIEKLEGEAALGWREKQGWPCFAVDLKITDDAGSELPWDGSTVGRLKVRGPGVARAYFRQEATAPLDAEGFLDTGDIATIDPHGYMHITDRAKDLIKSGGEWISSIDLENVAAGHPGVAEVAAVAVPHPRWGERPLLVVVPRPGAAPTKEALLTFFEGKVAKWCVPDDVAFAEELPHTATGKVDKKALRAMFHDHDLPGGRQA